MKVKAKSKKVFYVFAIVFYLLSVIMLYKGYDKMTNYRNSSYRSVNAYVGGDAYNYIINGNYATGFFVLSAGFLTTGTLLLTTGVLVNSRRRELAAQSNAASEPFVPATETAPAPTVQEAPEQKKAYYDGEH